MDTLTPTHGSMIYRDLHTTVSPIKDPEGDSVLSIESDGGDAINKGERTNVSDDVIKQCLVNSLEPESEMCRKLGPNWGYPQFRVIFGQKLGWGWVGG